MKFIDKIYIISLERHKIRKQIIFNDLDSAGFDTSKIEWINAINGNDLDIDKSIKDGIINPSFKDPGGILTKSIYGCALSHKMAYEKFLETYSTDPERALAYQADSEAWSRKYLSENGALALLPAFNPEGGKLDRAKKFLDRYRSVLVTTGKIHELDKAVKESYGKDLKELFGGK